MRPSVEAIGSRFPRAVEAVAICFLHSYANPEHETSLRAEILSSSCPSAVVTASCEVLPEYREYERFSTTALNAYVAPRMRRYLGELRSRLAVGRHSCAAFDHDIQRRLAACRAGRSDAGAVDAVRAGGRRDRRQLCRPAASFPDVITCDMGGTSTDVCLVRGGEFAHDDRRTGRRLSDQDPPDRHQYGRCRRRQHRGLASGGFLTVGPRSAGASRARLLRSWRHGPTVTDANVVLGRLASDQPLGGEIALDLRRRRRR